MGGGADSRCCRSQWLAGAILSRDQPSCDAVPQRVPTPAVFAHMCLLPCFPLQTADSVAEPLIEMRKFVWTETDHILWRGEPPKIEVTFDETFGFLLVVNFQVALSDSSSAVCFKRCQVPSQ